jgi:hypothetical protein
MIAAVRVQRTRPYSKEPFLLVAIRRMVTVAPPYTKKLWNPKDKKNALS